MKAAIRFSYQGQIFDKGETVELEPEQMDYLKTRKLVVSGTGEPKAVAQPEKKEQKMSTEKVNIKKP